MTGKVTVVMSEEPEGEEPALESLKGRSRSMRAVLVPETGMPRIRRCCLSSDTFNSKNDRDVKLVVMSAHLLYLLYSVDFSYLTFTLCNLLLGHPD